MVYSTTCGRLDLVEMMDGLMQGADCDLVRRPGVTASQSRLIHRRPVFVQALQPRGFQSRHGTAARSALRRQAR